MLLPVTVRVHWKSLKTPPPKPSPPMPPTAAVPPTARFAVRVQLLTVSGPPRPKLKLAIAPPTPLESVTGPVPPLLPLPPRTSLDSKTLLATVIAEPFVFANAPPKAVPTSPWPPAPPVALEPPTARLAVNLHPLTTRLAWSPFVTAPPLALATTNRLAPAPTRPPLPASASFPVNTLFVTVRVAPL